MTEKIQIHIISHTHWDREWFLTKDYTNKWLVPFFERLFLLLQENKEYKFVLDGQMLMVNDYLKHLPNDEREKKIALLEKYGKEKRLFFGPYWAQIDWRIVGPESIVRNILFGYKHARDFGNFMKVGWLLDNFGQIGQAPQIHRLAGIDSVFVWRGICFPEDDVSTEFVWESPDGSKVIASYFLNSYRNLMQITAFPEIAPLRVKNEVEKMKEFLTTPNVVLMNGYDLDTYPEDPLSVLKRNVAEDYRVFQSSPERYMDEVQKINPELQVLHGEMLSGRYLSVFPGTLSTRVYLKIWNYLCEYTLTRLLEPIGAIVWHQTGYYPQTEIEKLWQELIANQAHDNISGVCIDQVHRQMEKSYWKLFEHSKDMLEDMLSRICGRFPKDSLVAFNTNPFHVSIPLETDEGVIDLAEIPLLGYKVVEKQNVFPISQKEESIQEFLWENEYYRALLNPNGTLDIYDKSSQHWYKGIGYFYDEADAGDEYNYSPAEHSENFTTIESPVSAYLLYETPVMAKIRVETQLDLPKSLEDGKRSKTKTRLPIQYEILFDTTPLIKFHLTVKNTARDHRLKMAFPVELQNGKIIAEMPFEYVVRPELIDNTAEIPSKLRRLLVGARECEKEYSLPMKDFIAITDDSKVFGVMAKGLSEYEVRGGTIFVTLLRAVEWIARSNLKTRIGDAGPAMYTPDAQCLKEVRHEIGVYVGKGDIRGSDLTKWTQIFHNPPVIVKINENDGKNDEEFSLLNLEGENLGNLKLTATKIAESTDGIVIRFFNPYDETISLKLPKVKGKIFKVDLLENPTMELSNTVKITPHEIVTLKFEISPSKEQHYSSSFRILTPKFNPPLGEKTFDPIESKNIELLQSRKNFLLNHLKHLKSVINEKGGLEYYETMFDLLCTERTYLEVDLSLLLNKESLEKGKGKEKIRKQIEEIGNRLNDFRIKRRAYEYILDYWKTVFKKRSS